MAIHHDRRRERIPMSEETDRGREAAGDQDAAAEPRILAMPTPRATSLRDVLESIIAAVPAGDPTPTGRVRVTLDVPVGQFVDVDPGLFRGLVEGLVRAALAAAARPGVRSTSPAVREVVVTSIDSADLFELEIADSGSGPPDGAALAAARAVVQGCGGDLVVKECPEGGTAVTVRLARRAVRRKAA
jgi:signal transduction histidine kinase